ncbi:MAG: hypothetical protein AB7F86_10755 [Bdellovibrionales bacterium]
MEPKVPGDSYVAFFGTPISLHTVDHYVLYHNLKTWLPYARNADIIFAGNSKTLYGFHIPQFAKMMEPNRIKFYNLGFQQAEGWGFTKILFDRYDLKPKVLIINGEEFFPRGPSGFAEYVMEHTRWNAWKSVFEDERAFELMTLIHKSDFFPYWMVTGGTRAVFRSLKTGAWHWGFKQDGQQPVVFDPKAKWEEPPRDWVIKRAKEFKEYLDARGTQLIITWIPKEVPANFAEVKAIAETLNVPLVTVAPEGLFTFDHDHLSWESGRLFTERLVEKLKNDPVFHKLFMVK